MKSDNFKYFTFNGEEILKLKIKEEAENQIWVFNTPELKKLCLSDNKFICLFKPTKFFDTWEKAQGHLMATAYDCMRDIERKIERIEALIKPRRYPQDPYSEFGGAIIVEQPIGTDTPELFDIYFEWAGIREQDFFTVTLDRLELLIGPKYANEVINQITTVQPDEQWKDDGYLLWSVERHYGPVYNNLEFGE